MNQNVVDLLNAELPDNSRPDLSLVNANRADMQAWLANLSMLNIGDTARQLFTTLKELYDLNIDETTRYELIEVLRPALHTINSSLSKHYLNQNVLLDERAERIADLSQQLRVYAAAIYRNIALRLSDQTQHQNFGLFGGSKKRAQLLTVASAIHRGITEFIGLMYETQVLYLPIYKGLWQRIHELFELSSQLDLRPHRLNDENQVYDSTLSIDHVYLRAVFLAVSNTNKLRQAEIKKLYQFSELWAPLIHLSHKPNGHDLFLIDPAHDSPPMYITKYAELSPKTYYVDVRQLLAHFEGLTSSEPKLLNRAEGSLMSGSLKYHLILTFTAPLERSYARHPYQGTVDLSLGLMGAHYQMADQRPFEDVIDLAHAQINSLSGLQTSFSMGSSEVSLNFTGKDDGEDRIKAEALRESQETYRCDIVNISPGGYCVRWNGKTPTTLRTGELLTIREPTDKSWHIGLIRWVKQNPNSGANFGLEILSPRGKPCGASVLRKEGEKSEFMRALLLPEMKNLNRPATIITPILTFKVGYRIVIRLGREEVRAQLSREIMVTQSFSQFEFTVLRKDAPLATDVPVLRPSTGSKGDDYEEVWNTL